MDSETRRPEGADQGWQLAAAAFCVLLALWVNWTRKRNSAGRKLPLSPGPRGWPILGALPYLDGRRHEALHRLSAKYGPLMFVHLGSLPTVVASSSEMAKEILKDNYRITASRPDFMDMLLAGTETAAQALEWALTELIRNPAIMKKAQDELSSVVGSGRLVTEDDVPHLPYLNALVKETFRLHPPAPLLLPHASTDDCVIGGFHVPGGSLVFVNVWAIQRDPAVWETPLQFRLERFLGEHNASASRIDWKGQEFELIPFGSGRRICPAVNMASSELHLTLAHVLHSVDWAIPADQKPEDMDMAEEIAFNPKNSHPLLLQQSPGYPLMLSLAMKTIEDISLSRH